MKQTHRTIAFACCLRRQWIIAILISMIALAGMRNLTVWAAPLAQTVPPPTPTAENTPVPTATSAPSDNNDDNNDNEQPTATPLPPPTATATPVGLTARVNVAVLNVRGGPGTTFPVLGNVKLNEELRVLERNEFGDWWRICCTSNGAPAEGWVLAQFVQANFDVGQLMILVPLAPNIPVAPTPTPIPPPEAAPTPAAAVALALEVQQDPPYSWQGQALTLQFTLKNDGTDSAQTVELRDELPLELTYLGGEAVGGELIVATNELSRTIVTVTWPELTPGGNVTVALNLQVSPNVPNGFVFNNLAVASAQNAQPVTGGIAIGMPPTTLPDFR